MGDSRVLERELRAVLEVAGEKPARQEGWSTNVQNGFDMTPEPRGLVAVHWRARYDYVVKPNEIEAHLARYADMIRAAGFEVVDQDLGRIVVGPMSARKFDR
jgi:hypothetical protein